MTNSQNDRTASVSRRSLIAAGSSLAAGAAIGMPTVARAQVEPIKVGVQHPITGFLSHSGNLCRLGATLGIEDVNAAGGIKSLDGAKLTPLLSDNQSKVDVGLSEFEKLADAGVSAFIGPYLSGIAIATTEAANRRGLLHLCDVTTSDRVISPSKPTVFRFSPGGPQFAQEGIERLVALNNAAGKPAKTVMLIHEESETGQGSQASLAEQLPKAGFEIVDRVLHPNPTRDFSNILLKIRQRKPDILVIGNFYDEYTLLVRAIHQQKIKVQAIYSMLGGGASSYKFLREFPEAAQYVLDCNHWYNPKHPEALKLRARVEAKGFDFSYETWLNYNCVMLLADSLERAGSRKNDAIVAAVASSTFDKHFLPFGPTKFVDGRNTGARSASLQIIGKNIELVLPEEFASAKPIFPRPN